MDDYYRIHQITTAAAEKVLRDQSSAHFLGHDGQPSFPDAPDPVDDLMGMIARLSESKSLMLRRSMSVAEVQDAVRATETYKDLSQSQRDFIESRMAR